MRTGHTRQSGRARGFTLRELTALTAVAALGLTAMMVGAGQSRKSAGLAASLANLKKIGEAGANYLADFDDQLWSFTWTEDEHPTDYPDLQYPSTYVTAVMYQTTDIIRRLTGDDSIPRLDNRFRPQFTSTLVLADYLSEELPAEWMVSSGDHVRLEWLKHPDDPPDLGAQGAHAWEVVFGFYGSSYGLMPAFWAPNERVGNQPTIYQDRYNHGLLYIPYSGLKVGGQRSADVYSPSKKVQVAERESYYHGVRPVYYLHPTARVPVLMADGSASPRTTADANTSFKPNYPDYPEDTTLLWYKPNPAYETPTISGQSMDQDLESYYKWTRRGLHGIDFAGERAE